MFERSIEFQKELDKNELIKEATKEFLDKLTSPLDIYMPIFLDINTKVLNHILDLNINSLNMIPTASGYIYYEFTLKERVDSFVCKVNSPTYIKSLIGIYNGVKSADRSGDMDMVFRSFIFDYR